MRASVAIDPAPSRALLPPRDIRHAIEADRHAVERTLGDLLDSPQTRIDEAARRELSAGGKRLRPLLSCAVLRVLGRDPSFHMDHLIAVELAHTGSLLHDDIIDEASTRRGVKAAHLAFDVPTAVLAGDCLVVLALERLARGAPPDLLVALCSAIRDLCAGASLERQRLFDETVDLDHCRRVNRLKTASLFGYAALAGAILAGADRSAGRAAHAFGVALGEAFQTTDDLLDFCGDSGQLGKSIGRDLEMGMVTVPLAIALDRDRSLRRQLPALWRLVRDGGGGRSLLGRIRRRMTAVGALAATRQLAAEQTTRALAALDTLPPNRWRDQLREVTLTVLRRHK